MNKLLVVLLSVPYAVCDGFMYIPGMAPLNFQQDEAVDLMVNKMDSVKTQLDHEFYELPFCTPESGVEDVEESIIDFLAGDAVTNSAYKLRMNKIEACKVLCRKQYTEADLTKFEEKVHDEYKINWLVDGIPAATVYLQPSDDQTETMLYTKGFELGFVGPNPSLPRTKPGVAYINNHVRMLFSYHTDPDSFDGFRIVGFEVETFSVKHRYKQQWKGEHTPLTTCDPLNPVQHSMEPQPLKGPDAQEIIWTYDVKWTASEVKWASRWDMYLKLVDSKIHWFSILNSFVVVVFLSAMLAMIMLRTLHKDLARYNEELTDEEQAEETGWKLIHGDVFRPPTRGGLFSILLGTGYQLMATLIGTLLLACIGFLSPANPGGFFMALIMLFVFSGVVAGYSSTRKFKSFKLTEWKRNTFQTAVFFPGIMFVAFFILNLFVWGDHSSNAIPIGSLFALLGLWFGISVPLVYLGSYFAFKKPVPDPPVRVHNIPRLLPADQTWYSSLVGAMIIGGGLPFAACFMELFFVMTSVWQHQFYYVFPILTLFFIILAAICAEIACVLVYFKLCAEDYNWWWYSFISVASSGFYLFAYSVYYFFSQLQIDNFVSGLIFFGYMAMVSFTVWIATGTMGHIACHYFVWKIYASIKVD